MLWMIILIDLEKVRKVSNSYSWYTNYLYISPVNEIVVEEWYLVASLSVYSFRFIQPALIFLAYSYTAWTACISPHILKHIPLQYILLFYWYLLVTLQHYLYDMAVMRWPHFIYFSPWVKYMALTISPQHITFRAGTPIPGPLLWHY